MRSLFRLPALLPALALLLPACDDNSGSEPPSSGTTTSTPSSEGSGTSVGSGATSDTPTSTTTTSSTTPNTDTTGDSLTTGTTGGDTVGGTETSDASTGDPVVPPPPVGAAALLPWLEAGNYSRWDAEAERHPSQGPHFDGVRTFVNATLLDSLEAGSDDHPVGSSVVKELYGAGPDVGGWAVMVKVAAGSSVDSWYWYESFQGTTYADDTGVSLCGNCHGRGVDFVRTTLPL
ncbi:MAG: hypothetical protein ACRBN8_38085 [Nannocystales bacterium]